MTKPTTDLIVRSTDVVQLKDVVVPDKFYNRISTGVKALDELFGNSDMPGIMIGSTILFTGMPGAGKTTMSLQLADVLQTDSQRSVLYNMGEESIPMVKMAANRMKLRGEFCMSQHEDVDRLIDYVTGTGVEILFVDSLQTMKCQGLQNAWAMRETTARLINLAHEFDIVVFVVGHITKGGVFAGPQGIQHDVDAHAHLRFNKDTGNRVFEFLKNRFGVSKLPVEFSLTANGMDFSSIEQQEPEGGGGSTKLADRREQIKNAIREELLAGRGVSGYCYERLHLECSGGFFRGMLRLVVRDLENEGHVVVGRKIDQRETFFVEV